MTMLAHIDDLVAGYAFGALGTAEREYVEGHIATCRECAESIWEAQQLVSGLPFAVTPYKAPPDLKQATLEQIRAQTANEAAEEPARAVRPEPRRATRGTRARTITVPPWVAPLLLRTIPWTLAVAGWVLVALLLIYSHGQADRLTATRQADQKLLAGLTRQRDDAETIQQFLLTPGVEIFPLIYQAGHAPHTNVALFAVPGYLHAVIGARGLAVLPSTKIYEIWGWNGHGPYVPLGPLSTAGPLAQGVSVLVATQPVDQYAEVALSIEFLPVPKQPARPPVFLVKIHPGRLTGLAGAVP